MKKLFILLFSLLIMYVVYTDLTVGTLPSQSQKAETAVSDQPLPEAGMPAFRAKVEPGETVISIEEHHINRALPVSIQDLIKDFRKLNPGKSPDTIRIGSTYFFPDYTNK